MEGGEECNAPTCDVINLPQWQTIRLDFEVDYFTNSSKTVHIITLQLYNKHVTSCLIDA